MNMPAAKNVCPKCRNSIAPHAQRCGMCGADLSFEAGPTIPGQQTADEPPKEAPSVPPPQPYEMPPWIGLFNRWLLGCAVVLTLAVEAIVPSTDRAAIVDAWFAKYSNDFRNGHIGDGHWTEAPGIQTVPVYIVAPQQYLTGVFTSIQKAGLGGADARILTPRQDAESLPSRRGTNRREFYLYLQDEMLLGVNIEYWSGGSVVPAFTWSDAVSLEYLYRWRLIPLLLLLAGAYGTRTLVVGGYRKRRRDEYRQYEEARTQSLFDARSRLEKARASWQKGDTAKALVALQEILADNPTYGEARELKRLISRGKDAHVAVLSADQAAAQGAESTASVLMLRVLGTPYAYQAPPGAARITLGRQRRTQESMPADGNDVVIRVPGSDERSRRISRHHLVIERIDEDYFVLDESGGRTLVDGRRPEPDKPMRIRSGSRITLANVVTLEVAVRSGLTLGKNAGVVNAGPVTAGNGVQFEATIGNMCTIAEGAV